MLRHTSFLAIAVLCAGCGGVTPGQITSASMGAAPDSVGTVVFGLNRRGSNCPVTNATFAREQAGEYHTVVTAQLGNTMFGYEHYKAVTMAPGTYHLVQVSCTDGRFVTSLGKPKVEQLLGPIKTQTNKYERSLGTFQVERAGDVVNLGMIEMNTGGLFDGGPPIAVRDLGGEALTQLKSTNPALASRMVSRPIALAAMPNAADILSKALAELEIAKAKAATAQPAPPVARR